MNFLEDLEPILKLMCNLLEEDSSLKQHVDHNPLTPLAGVNSILGAMATHGSFETIDQIYTMIMRVILQHLQRLAESRGMVESFRNQLALLCASIENLNPFAHRTTVQAMLNHHTQESSDRWLEKSFQGSIDALSAIDCKPPEVVINQDPHFAEFKPSFKNGENRQILIGGRTTLKTGYQLNLANISPIGLYMAIDLTPKRQQNLQDLGDLHYALTFGKALDRARRAKLHVKHTQADRGLCATSLFAVSQQHAWPTAGGEIGELAEYARDVFFLTP